VAGTASAHGSRGACAGGGSVSVLQRLVWSGAAGGWPAVWQSVALIEDLALRVPRS